VAHGAQVVDLVWLHLLNDADQVGRIGKIAVMHDETNVFLVRVLIKMIDTIGIEQRTSAFDTVYFISFGE